MRIRNAATDELSLLQQIEIAAGKVFTAIGMPEIAEDEPLSIAELARYTTDGLAWVTANDDDVAVAYLIADSVDGVIHIEQVSVHPDHARHGLGRAMLDHVAAHASSKGVPALTLTTFTKVAWNAPYYERCGFRTMNDSCLTPGLRSIRKHEADLGLDRWPRVCMRREL